MVAQQPTRPSVADVLRRYAPLANYSVNRDQARAVRHLTQCRTFNLGGQLWGCGACNNERYRYHSCRHSHCPTCNAKPRDDWLQKMLAEQLPVGYSHVVFTVPHELLPLFAASSDTNPRLLYDLLFEIAYQVMQRYARKHHRLKIGVTLVLHTWGQRMNAHPHVHCLLILGGLTLDGKTWVTLDSPHTLIGSADIADRFRKLFLKRLRLKVRYGKLRLPPGFNSQLLAADGPLAQKRWMVNVQSPPEKYVGSTAALRYLARYARGTAIGNGRMVSDDGESVTFSIKDYRRGGKRKNVTIPGTEFVRRFLLHILPFRFSRIRHRGFLAAKVKRHTLPLIRKQLGVEEMTEMPAETDSFHGDADNDTPQLKPPRCPKCGAKEMIWKAEIEPKVSWIRKRYSHYAFRARGAGFGMQPGSNPPRPP